MTQASYFKQPMARKKRVSNKFSPDSYRVISIDAEETRRVHLFQPISMADQNIIGQSSAASRPIQSHRYNRPNPTHAGFLRHDVKLLNDPICNVYTVETQADQHRWWPSRTSDVPLTKPDHTLDSTVRYDYQWRGSGLSGNTRHSSNPNKTPVLGSVPVTFLRQPSGEQRLLKENISYEHQFDSRIDPAYPPRGKRHGAFVWDQFSNDHAERLIKYYSQQNSEVENVKSAGGSISKANKMEPADTTTLETPENKSSSTPTETSTQPAVLPPINP